MTVANISPRITYNYTGPGTYSFPYAVPAETDLSVKHMDTDGVITTLTYGVNYTVSLLAVGGTITTTYSETTGTLIIERDVEYTQETDWVNNDPMDVEILEADLDKQIMLSQQMKLLVEDGNIATNWQGDWVTGTSYAVRDIVTGPDDNW